MFAVVRHDGTQTLAAVDRLRSIPLFFCPTLEGIAVADTAAALLGKTTSALHVNPVSAEEFRLTGYTTGTHTLFEGLSQVPAGHTLLTDARDAASTRLTRYYAFRHVDAFVATEAELVDRLQMQHERVFRRLLDDVAGRPIVVPLSGGYDSRLIGVMLRDLGCRDVLCYTYGLQGNWEARISRELASHLGFRWTMIDYSAERWHAWRELPEFQRYFRESGNACASPHFQDWPAVYELHRTSQLAPDSVFVPGHSGDFLAGSHIPSWFASRARVSREGVLKALFDAHYTLWRWPTDTDGTLRRALIERIEAVTGRIADGSADEAADAFEAWDCAERQAKFIVNSVRVYESFGYEWRLPLFDSELMDFWARVPLALRNGRALYYAFAQARQSLPISQANTDRATWVAGALRMVDRMGLKPVAKRLREQLRRARWRHAYERDTIGWFAVIDRDEFRRRYTGREIGHSFFATRYLDTLTR